MTNSYFNAIITNRVSQTVAGKIDFLREESPGSKEHGCRLTAGGGDSKDSATENKRRSDSVSVEMCGKSAHGVR